MEPLTHPIVITEFDENRLRGLLRVLRERSAVDAWNLDALSRELDRAEVVSTREVPSNVVTMNSRVGIRDLDSDRRFTVSLVFPGVRDSEATSVAVLSPFGLALLGCRAGHMLEWDTPAGRRRLLIETVHYQPEANGEFFR